MVFERVIKGGHSLGTILPDEVSISKSCIAFGKGIIKTLNGGFVEVYIDRKNNLIGFVDSKNQVLGYKLGKSNNLTGVVAKNLKRSIYKAKLQDGIWVIKVDKIPEDIPTTKTK